jgi:hypothetical protein
MVRSVVVLMSVVVLAVIPVTGVAQSIVGRWHIDIEGFPTYWVFSDCGTLEIHIPGSSPDLTYRVEAEGPPLKVEICPTDPGSGKCGSIYAYLLGNETLQLVPDLALPRTNPVLLTDMLMQRVPDERGEAHCEEK